GVHTRDSCALRQQEPLLPWTTAPACVLFGKGELDDRRLVIGICPTSAFRCLADEAGTPFHPSGDNPVGHFPADVNMVDGRSDALDPVEVHGVDESPFREDDVECPADAGVEVAEYDDVRGDGN